MNTDFQWVENPQADERYRKAYFALARRVFGLDFSVWYRSGFWDGRFIPYTLFDGERAAASVGVALTDLRARDGLLRCAQLSTVMTDPEYRGRGLARRLMEEALGRWRDRCDAVYLYANDSVLEFYPRFGFERAGEARYSLPVAHNREESVRRLDLASAADRALLLRAYAAGNPYSALAVENGAGLLMFHCLTFLQENVFYLPGHDAVVIAKRDGENLLCHDVYARHADCPLAGLLGTVAPDGVQMAVLGFTPRPEEGAEASPARERDTTAFVLRGKENPFAGGRRTLPFLSRA